METIKDVSNFLNQMDLYNILTGVKLSTINIIRKTLIDEFENINLDKLVEMLKTLDDLYIEHLRIKITTLRNKIFDMYDQKMVEKSNNA